MREFQEIKWVRCGVCGEEVPLCKADFAATGAGYWCWACSARETSPTLRQGKGVGRLRSSLEKFGRALGGLFSGLFGTWKGPLLVWIVFRVVYGVSRLLVHGFV